ncbi:MAG: DUF2909 domain-containing protein [Stenotrophobium sp.]
MFAKAVLVVLLLAVISALFVSVFFLVNDRGDKRRALTALKIRVALSVLMITFLIVAYAMGWIHPHPALQLH